MGHVGIVRAASIITVSHRHCATTVHGELHPLHATVSRQWKGVYMALSSW
jgi:hypothetical protein